MAERKDGPKGWFDAGYWQQLSRKSTTTTPAEAQALVDTAIRNLGIDPEATKDAEGWRHLSLGNTQGHVNIVEWDPGVYYLVIWSPIVDVPADAALQLLLFEVLLRLNHQQTDAARFSVEGGIVFLSVVRPIQGLDLEEALDALHVVLALSSQIGEKMREKFELLMPQIAMDGQTREGVLTLQESCDLPTRKIFRHLIEAWQAKGGTITAGRNTVVLRGKGSGRILAALVGHAAAGPVIVISWGALDEKWGLLPQDARTFQCMVPRPARFKAMETTAHLPVDPSFTLKMADELVQALLLLEKAQQRTVPPAPPAQPDLQKKWGLCIPTQGATQRNINTLLESCSPPVQALYVQLIQGWVDAGLAVYTNNSRLVYLRLSVEGHTFALCTLRGAQVKDGPRIDLDFPLYPDYFLEHHEAKARYEARVATLPGFQRHGSNARISLEGTFGTSEAQALLDILFQLARDVAP